MKSEKEILVHGLPLDAQRLGEIFKRSQEVYADGKDFWIEHYELLQKGCCWDGLDEFNFIYAEIQSCVQSISSAIKVEKPTIAGQHYFLRAVCDLRRSAFAEHPEMIHDLSAEQKERINYNLCALRGFAARQGESPKDTLQRFYELMEGCRNYLIEMLDSVDECFLIYEDAVLKEVEKEKHLEVSNEIVLVQNEAHAAEEKSTQNTEVSKSKKCSSNRRKTTNKKVKKGRRK